MMNICVQLYYITKLITQNVQPRYLQINVSNLTIENRRTLKVDTLLG